MLFYKGCVSPQPLDENHPKWTTNLKHLFQIWNVSPSLEHSIRSIFSQSTKTIEIIEHSIFGLKCSNSSLEYSKLDRESYQFSLECSTSFKVLQYCLEHSNLPGFVQKALRPTLTIWEVALGVLRVTFVDVEGHGWCEHVALVLAWSQLASLEYSWSSRVIFTYCGYKNLLDSSLNMS